MNGLPLRSISISDFRRLEGNRVLPLDAPIVLLHGPNGTGKTSVLSALELALTGDIRSMRRQDDRFTAHLPFHGQDFATLRVEVSPELDTRESPEPMTVGGSRIEGGPALSRDAAQFYGERCYLDQTSLGRLLELYEHTEGQEESALARFVNEILGLEQLDALRAGLRDSLDFRRLKKLSEPLDDADANAKEAARELLAANKALDETRKDLDDARSDLIESMQLFGFNHAGQDDAELLAAATDMLGNAPSVKTLSPAAEIWDELTSLGGRIAALAGRPSTLKLGTASEAVSDAMAKLLDWEGVSKRGVEQWRADAAAAGLQDLVEPVNELADAISGLDQRLARHGEISAEVAEIGERVERSSNSLAAIEEALADVRQQAGSLAEGLAALREHSTANICPVCDRNFADVSPIHLSTHIDRKIEELTAEGLRLQELQSQRENLTEDYQRDRRTLDNSRDRLLSPEEFETAVERRSTLIALQTRFVEIEPAADRGLALARRLERAEAELAEQNADFQELALIWAELRSIAQRLAQPEPDLDSTTTDTRERLAEVAAAQLDAQRVRETARELMGERLKQMEVSFQKLTSGKNAVASAAEFKHRWDSRVAEARRRQDVAKVVHTAASDARATIVQRVFTESLNSVWQSVFTRLAPREPFVPAFGIPTSTKTALEVKLETIHSSGVIGGAPQMMLSAGNLNTAALSLFIALHLAVDRTVPCLVFDDPVQSMDEVHIAQFAALMRLLSKQHDRQIVIAVHERALFDYLALELSPSHQGDELLTIELGSRSLDDDQGVHRRTWAPDSAIAV